MMNRDLLKEAIADAKAVKETAIANAKAVLEEVFTKNLRAELASKLEEMDNYENMEVEEAMKAKKEKDMMEEFEVNEKMDEMDEEIDLNEILAELEEGEDKDDMDEAKDMEMDEAEDMEMGEMGDEEVDLEDMTEDDLKSFIEDVIADMVAAGELEAGDEFEAEMGGEDMEAEDEMGDMEELDEMDEVSWNEKNNPTRGATLDRLAPTKVGQTTSAYAINVKENILTDPTFAEVAAGVAGLVGSGTALAYIIDMLKSGKAGDVGKKLANAIEKTAGAAGVNKPTEEGKNPTEEMDQMEELKKELQEVNLLNAKLLYTNKIFKEKTLNESQKIKVLKAFDKAGSVKEAKLIFETLNEGMAAKTSKTSMMNEIKSSASKSTGVILENRRPIVDVDPMVARWQKLAGIK